MKRLMILAALAALQAQAGTAFVSVSGDDVKGDGSEARPYASLHLAIEKIRGTKNPKVTMMPGVYRIERTLKLGSADSNLEIASGGEGAAVLSGGCRIRGWNRVRENLYAADVPWVTEREKGFRRLTVNGESRPRARLPKRGYFKAQKDDLPATAQYNNPRPNLYFAAGDIRPEWEGITNGEIVVHHFWNDSHLRIAEVNFETNRVRLVTPCGKSFATGWSNNEVGSNPGLYFIANIPAALTEPGEWYLDYAQRKVFYLAKQGEDMATAEVEVPKVERLVEIAGTPEVDGKWAENIVFRGISFRDSQYELPKWNVNNAQGSSEIGAAVVVTGSRNCRFENCVFTGLSAYAVLFGRGSWNNIISRSRIANIGGGGVRIAGGKWDEHPFAQARGNEVSDCEIANWGEDFKSGCGVLAQHAAETRILHNHLHDAHYTGISIGWNWGYLESVSWGSEIGWNHLHDVGKSDLLSDMGGIYTLGVQPGTRIHHNLVHDISARCYGGWGIYQDEGATHAVVEDNIVYNTKNAPYNIHFAKEILVRNNIFAYGKAEQIHRQRREPHVSLYFFNNIVLWKDGVLHTGDLGDAEDKTYSFYGGFFATQRDLKLWKTFECDRNIYWNPTKKLEEVEFGGKTWQEWQASGKDVHSLYADPQFADPEHGDWTVKENSPALKTGFVPFDLSAVGPRRN